MENVCKMLQINIRTTKINENTYVIYEHFSTSDLLISVALFKSILKKINLEMFDNAN